MFRRVRRAWGVVRRFLLVHFRAGYVRRQAELRSGECSRCGKCCRILYRCPMLAEGNHCQIYGKRPQQCRQFPIDARDLKDVPECSFRFPEMEPAEEKVRARPEGVAGLGETTS